MDDTQQLLKRIEALSDRTGASLATLSGKLFGSGIRYGEIKAGGSLTMTVYARAVQKLGELEDEANAKQAAA